MSRRMYLNRMSLYDLLYDLLYALRGKKGPIPGGNRAYLRRERVESRTDFDLEDAFWSKMDRLGDRESRIIEGRIRVSEFRET